MQARNAAPHIAQSRCSSIPAWDKTTTGSSFEWTFSLYRVDGGALVRCERDSTIAQDDDGFDRFARLIYIERRTNEGVPVDQNDFSIEELDGQLAAALSPATC